MEVKQKQGIARVFKRTTGGKNLAYSGVWKNGIQENGVYQVLI